VVNIKSIFQEFKFLALGQHIDKRKNFQYLPQAQLARDISTFLISGCFSCLLATKGLCHSGTDQRDYLYFIAEGYYKLNVS